MNKSIYFLIFSLFITQLSLAQTDEKIKFHRIPSGISNNWIHSIFQDKRGFMWFGTDNGLNKFDGYGYTVYENNALDSNSITKRAITHLFEDRNEGIWISTGGGGLNHLNVKTSKLTIYSQKNDLFHPNSNTIQMVKEDEDGMLWIVTNNGLNTFDPKTKKFQHYSNKQPDLDNQTVKSVGILEMNEKYIWLITGNGGVARFDKKTQKYTFFTKEIIGLKENYIRTSCKSNQKNKYWLGYKSQGLSLISIINDQVVVEKHYTHNPGNSGSISGNNVLSLCESKQGKLWIGVENGGINILNLKDEVITNYKHNNEDDYSIANDSPWALCEDSFGNMWIGTFNQGINVVYNQYHSKFEHYYQKSGNENELVNNNVSGFWENSNKTIWIGTDGGGVSLWDRQKQTFTNFTSNSKPPLKLSANSILSVSQDKQGKTWFSTWQNGCNVFNPQNQTFTNYNIDNKGLSSNTHFSMMSGNDGNFYMCAWENTLDVFDVEKEKILWSKTLPNNSRYLYRIIEDQKQNIWIATESGLVLITKKNRHSQGQSSVFQHKDNDATSLSSNKVNEVYEDRQGNIWAGTSSGLNRYDPKTQKFKIYRKKDGLVNEDIRGIVEDIQGFLWITTGKGMSKFDVKTNTFENFVKEDGLQENEFSRWAIYRTQKGEILVGGINGFNIFDPAKLQKNPFKPIVYLNGFKLFNKSVEIAGKSSPLKQSIEFTQELYLTHTQTVFTIEFVALNYTRPEKNQYAYMLEGFEKEWNYVGNRREATYTSLPAGTYTFRVKAANNDGVWSQKETILKIIILPPWWETLWFRLFVLFVIISSVVISVRWRINAIKAQNMRLEKLVEKRTYELKEKNDEVLQQAEELFQQAEELKTQRDYIQNQNIQLSTQNQVVEEKSRQIRQSINAAQTIQQAILPHEEKLVRLLGNHFLIYRPKDVVSGDFYWLSKIDGQTILVVADCTGHGVPGAFMTLIGNSILDKIVKVLKIIEPAQILDKLHEEVYDALKQKYTGNNYGMDAVVITLGEEENQHRKIKFAGAKNSIFYLETQNPKDVIELKGSRRAIGGQQNEDISFDSQEVILSIGSMIYLGSDGFMDQNNAKRKRLGSEKFTQLISQNAELPIIEQKSNFQKALEDHAKDTFQRDDILLIGIKV